MHLEGTIKLVLKPLRGDTSGFGAVLVSLKEDVSILPLLLLLQTPCFHGELDGGHFF